MVDFLSHISLFGGMFVKTITVLIVTFTSLLSGTVADDTFSGISSSTLADDTNTGILSSTLADDTHPGILSLADGIFSKIFCMNKYCKKHIKQCVYDENCRMTFSCMVSCGMKNQKCIFNCLYDNEDPVFDNMMKCIVTDHKCMSIPSPKPTVTCKPPPASNLARNFDVEKLSGTWYIVRGKNQIYDCFGCQNTTFHASSRNGVYFAYNYLKHETQIDTIRPWNESTPASGVLRYESTQMGRTTVSQWRILDFDSDFIYTYYCGSITNNYFYEGSVVYSKSKAISEETINRIVKVATSIGYDLNDYCTPSFDTC